MDIEVHPLLQLLIAAGAVATASAAIWRYWVRNAFRVTREAAEALIELAELLRQVRDFMAIQVPVILDQLKSGSRRFEEHERRISRVEKALDITDEEEAT